MKQVKRIFKGLFLGSIAILPLISQVSLSQNLNNISKEELLKFYKETDYRKFYEDNRNEVEQFFEKAKNNEELNYLLNSLDDSLSIENYLDDISKLNLKDFDKKVLTLEFKRFFKRELIKQREHKTGRTFNKWPIKKFISSKREPVKVFDTGANLKASNKEIIKNGLHMFRITDNVFAKDVSYISWTNEEIVNLFFSRFLNNDDQAYSSNFIDSNIFNENNPNLLEIELENLESSKSKWRHPFLSGIAKALKITYVFENLGKKLENKLNEWTINKPDFLEKSRNGEFFIFMKYFYANGSRKFTSFKHFLEVMKSEMNIPAIAAKTTTENIFNNPAISKFIQSLKSNFDKTGKLLSNFKIVSKAFSKFFLSLAIYDLMIGLKEFIENSSTDYINVKSFYNIITYSSAFMLSLASASNSVPLVGQLVSLAILSLDIALKTIKVGNGHTFYENFNDHGLNDWEYQLKNNFDNMLYWAISYSDNFRKGVTWKVTDGWFSFPDLYIATTEEENNDFPYWKYKYKWLSPGNEFNFGNKIPSP
ncbi:hypothetical protein [Mycoplasmopsis gallopavonis]|uniref:Uncharacterized protein n=1 Tax=Mycoplasmopsis gallopavonis TaxID=76629 RepID=A0A449AYR9_9BACT|nr:hypothetical protein [Mycoplasmopsis gallopavonis]RIV16869.1 hypothetical protein D1113_00590 [Mycoplasmopsis gallopavonis]VEU72673.1 Uncharacterised protein [Mycoplasmopsis gallopavonis]